MCRSHILIAAIALAIICSGATTLAQAPTPEPLQYTLPRCYELEEYLRDYRMGPRKDPLAGIERIQFALEKGYKLSEREPREAVADRLAGFCARSEVLIIGTEETIQLVLSAASLPTDLPWVANLSADYICDGCWLRLYSLAGRSRDEQYDLVGRVVTAASVYKTLRNPVYADPNYLIQSATVVVDPYHIGEGPFGTKGKADKNAFDNQWAFAGGPGGIGLKQLPTPTGTSIPVYVFDTTPHAVGDHSFPDSGVNVKPLKFQPMPPEISCGASEHGLFVAGLIHRIAPDSPITVYPVLDGCGKGTLYTLLAAIGEVNSALKAKPQPTVLNFSLGVVFVPEQYGLGPSGQAAHLDSVISNLPPDSDPEGLLPQAPANLQQDVQNTVTLTESLQVAYTLGGISVASAGNESGDKTEPLPMQQPASYSFVIGAAANNKYGESSCYSNLDKQGWWVMAPGGDGRTHASADPCKPRAMECKRNDPDCEFGVVSLDGLVPPSYAVWAGTSFAAPIVSGLAARCLQENASPSSTRWQKAEVANKVWTAIDGGATIVAVGTGKVISATGTIANCMNLQ